MQTRAQEFQSFRVSGSRLRLGFRGGTPNLPDCRPAPAAALRAAAGLRGPALHLQQSRAKERGTRGRVAGVPLRGRRGGAFGVAFLSDERMKEGFTCQEADRWSLGRHQDERQQHQPVLVTSDSDCKHEVEPSSNRLQPFLPLVSAHGSARAFCFQIEAGEGKVCSCLQGQTVKLCNLLNFFKDSGSHTVSSRASLDATQALPPLR